MEELAFDLPKDLISDFDDELVNFVVEEISTTDLVEEIIKPERKKRAPRNYINNEDFCNALIKYKEDCVVYENTGRKKPSVPNYIGECFMKIAEGLGRKPNFYNYSFKDMMISDAIENALQYLHNFNPTKSRNAFAYFTQIMYFAFLRRIKREKNEQYVKYKSAESFFMLDDIDPSELGDNIVSPTEIYDNMKDFIKKFEESEFKIKEKIKRPKTQKGVLENFL